MCTNSVTLRNLRSLSGVNFFIPDYQRGYRWSSIEAEQLLNDLKEFCTRDRGEGEFYCLQPIVVKKKNWTQEKNGKVSSINGFEVIDGQQRLTTLYILMKCKEQKIKAIYDDFKPFSIKYETRVEFDSQKFLENINLSHDSSSEFIDFYYMRKVYDFICEWFKKVHDGKFDYDIEIIKALLSQKIEKVADNLEFDKANNVRVIWYEVGDSEGVSSNDIFSRLNIGKIPLTNAELIKALLLRRGNFIKSEASIKQIQISSEWNQIEQKLQNDAFWYFLYNTNSPFDYDNRIEFLFDLMKNRTSECEYYYTFNEFYKQFEALRKDSSIQSNSMKIERIWLEVKQTFQTLEEWYEDRTLYHLIGFLVEQGEKIKDLREQSLKLKKADFIAYIKRRIRKAMNGITLSELSYEDRGVKKTLLLFNVVTVLNNTQSAARFPFSSYKKENWDIEHITSQTDVNINDEKKRREWVKDMFTYFTGKSEEGDVEDYLSELSQKLKKELKKTLIEPREKFVEKILRELLSLVNTRDQRINGEEFSKVFKHVQSYFYEDKLKDKDSISNLALLDAQTNRGYRNSFFPVKRAWIINKDKQGIFIPQATKNVFLKYYSTKSNNLLYWGQEDADDYLEALEKGLIEYLGEDEKC